MKTTLGDTERFANSMRLRLLHVGRRKGTLVWALVCALFGVYTPTVIRSKNGAVSSENILCSEAGVEVLREGGSAVDGAIATALCIGVTNMYSSGIGGGGFMLLRSKKGEYEYIDFREAAPKKAFTDMYKNDPTKAQVGGLAVGVPGELRGFEAAHKKYGILPWKRLFQSAIRISREGWRVTPILAKRIKVKADSSVYKIFNIEYKKSSKEVIMRDPSFGEVFAPNGTLLEQGDVIKRTKFAHTLEAIAEEGASLFYEGRIAKSIVETVTKSGGILTLEDMKSYQAESRPPLYGHYHGKKIVTTPAPASGAVLLSILNIVEGFNFAASGKTPLNAHRLVEAMKFAYGQRTFYGDPMDPIFRNITEIEKKFSQKSYADLVRANISDATTFEPSHYNPQFDVKEDHGTMHVSVLTADGDAVALTSTVNLIFGARIMDKETGIILNDEMDDFSIPDVPNAFGLSPSPYNFIQPFKRPLSSSVPVITEMNGFVECIAGASGGSRIITATLQVLLNMLDFGMNVGEAVAEPRLHHQLSPNEVEIEFLVSQELVKYLSAKGHAVKVFPQDITITGVEAIHRLPNGIIEAASDSRKGGVSAGW
ncbi:hypothetical protein HDU67_001925 [Dinochytrium kinnereticum]|nr:hypothetical protein HDU67_001925 [Dinochytrium kinnereticum]